MADMPLLDIDIDLPKPRTRGTLLSVAHELPSAMIRPGGAERWLAGVTWMPYPGLNYGIGEIGCDVTDNLEERTTLPDLIDASAFLIWDALRAHARCNKMSTLQAILRSNMVDFITTAFAAQLETLLADSDSVLAGAVVSLMAAIPALEDAYASTYPNSPGVIHTTTGFYNVAKASRLGEFDDAGVLRTATGTAIVGDGGHTGGGTVDGHAATDGVSAWTYITSEVWYAVSRPQGLGVLPNAEDIDLLHNELTPVVSRYGLLATDTHAGSFAALVGYEATGG